MSKQELFGLLRLLSALESILLSHKVPTPDYLFEAMGASVTQEQPQEAGPCPR